MAAENKIDAVVVMYDRISQHDLERVNAFRKKHTKKPSEVFDVHDRLFMFHEGANIVGTAVMAYMSPGAHFPNEKKNATVIPYVYDICFNHKKKYALVDKMLDYLKAHIMEGISGCHIDHKRINLDIEEKDEMCDILERNGFVVISKWTNRINTKKYISYTWYGESPAKKKEELLFEKVSAPLNTADAVSAAAADAVSAAAADAAVST